MGFLDTGSLPTGKSFLRRVPVGADPLKHLAATEWNDVMQAVLDTRVGIIAAPTVAFDPQTTRPAAYSNGGEIYRFWVRDSDKHIMYYNGTSDLDLTPGAGFDLDGTYSNGSAGPQIIALDSTRLGVVFRDNATPIAATLFGVQNSSGSTKMVDVLAASVQFGVDVYPVTDSVPKLGLIDKRWLGLFNNGILSGRREESISATFTFPGDTFWCSASNSSARTVTLIAANSVPNGTPIIIKDSAGNAGTNNITVNRAGSDLIDGATSKVITTNYGVLRLISNGVNGWEVW